MSRTGVAAYGLIVSVLACDGRRAAPIFTATDSAGTVVAVSSASAWGMSSPWSISADPMLDLTRTGPGPGHQFFRVTGATRLDDGRIVVANAGSSELRQYSPTGLLLRSSGRDGEGPGEYRQIARVDRYRGDSIVVYSRPSRVSILDSELTFVRSFEVRGLWQSAYALGDGSTVLAQAPSSFEDPTEVGGVVRQPAPLVRYGPDGTVMDTVATAAGYEQLLVPRGAGLLSASFLYGKTMAVAVGRGAIAFGSADAMELGVFDVHGRLSMIVRVPGYSLEISHAEWAAERAAFLGPEPSETRRRILELTPERSTRPAYTDIFIDAESHFWLGEYVRRARADDPRGWEVFEADGRWLGRVETPPRFRILEIGAEYLLGVSVDDVGVERVQLLTLIR